MQPSAAAIANYERLAEHAGVIALEHLTQIEITGNDRASFLHGFCTNDIKRLTSGEGCEVFVTDLKGRVLGHLCVFCGPDSLLLETTPGQAEHLLQHLDRYLVREDVQLHDRSAERASLFVAGSAAAELLKSLLDAEPPRIALAHGEFRLGDVPLSVRRVAWNSSSAFHLVCRRQDGVAVRQALREASAVECPLDVWEMLRVEAGWPCYGRDITVDNLPQEVDRDSQAISFAKGCYLGQETVARLDALGHVNRRLVLLRIDGDAIPETPSALQRDGKDQGKLTSATWSPAHAAPLALGYVKAACSQAGSVLDSVVGIARVVDPTERK